MNHVLKHVFLRIRENEYNGVNSVIRRFINYLQQSPRHLGRAGFKTPSMTHTFVFHKKFSLVMKWAVTPVSLCHVPHTILAKGYQRVYTHKYKSYEIQTELKATS